MCLEPSCGKLQPRILQPVCSESSLWGHAIREIHPDLTEWRLIRRVRMRHGRHAHEPRRRPICACWRCPLPLPSLPRGPIPWSLVFMTNKHFRGRIIRLSKFCTESQTLHAGVPTGACKSGPPDADVTMAGVLLCRGATRLRWRSLPTTRALRTPLT